MRSGHRRLAATWRLSSLRRGRRLRAETGAHTRRHARRATSRRRRCGCRRKLAGGLSSSRSRKATGSRSAGLIARLSTTDAELNIRRAEAERDRAIAQLRLLEAGARPEEIRQAQAQLDSAEADVRATTAELQSAEADLQRFEALLAVNAGSRKQRDDAQTRRDVAVARVAAARDRARAAAEGLGRLKSGARREEIAAARARHRGCRCADCLAAKDRRRCRAHITRGRDCDVEARRRW